jgi:ABC-type nitrate/sulfonate/bicarbonate transport system permease component
MEYLESDRTRSTSQFTGTRVEKKPAGERNPFSWLPLILALLGISAWEIAARLGWVSMLFFPAPSIILRSLIHLSLEGVLLRNIFISLIRLFLGILIGGGIGTLLGLAMGMSPSLRQVLEPIISAAHPVPKIAIFPLFLVMFGIGETSKIVVTSLAAFFPMLINTMIGVRQIHPIYFEVVENYGANKRKTFTRVVLPGSLPAILAALLLALNITLLLTIAVEMVSARDGLGGMIWLAWQTMRTEEMYASLVIIVLLGIAFNQLFHRLVLRLIPWQPERER